MQTNQESTPSPLSEVDPIKLAKLIDLRTRIDVGLAALTAERIETRELGWLYGDLGAARNLVRAILFPEPGAKS